MSARHPQDPSHRPPPERSVLKLPQPEAEAQLDAKISRAAVFAFEIDALVRQLDSEPFRNRHAYRRRSEELDKLERKISEWRNGNRKWLERYLGGEAAEEYRFISAQGNDHIAGDQKADLRFLRESIRSDIEKLESIRYRLSMWCLEYIASAPTPSQPQHPPEPATTGNHDPRPTPEDIAAWIAAAPVQPQYPQRSIQAVTSAPVGHVFISYVSEDSETVNALQRDLEQAGITAWRDRSSLGPGDRWKDSIRQAIASGAFFLCCFSEASRRRPKSYMNEELSLAVEELRVRSREQVWFLPVVLPGGEVPDWPITPAENLRDFNYVVLSPDRWSAGIETLTRTIRNHKH